MPSGRTHDRITLWGLPLVVGVTFAQTRNGNLTLLVAGGFLFGGLMFGPDLDIYSVQYQRWGWLRWLWLPYQKSLRHRSLLSHGPIIGTALRVVYLALAALIVAMLVAIVVQLIWHQTWSWEVLSASWLGVSRYYVELFTAFVGLELGAMSHYLSDWGGSAYKKFQKKGIQGLLPKRKVKKRKVTRTSRQPIKKGTREK
jgi:uncharacterized metal-binding protein